MLHEEEFSCMPPIIEIKNLSAGYDDRTVLHDVNLTFYERDFLGIIGPNGGGKTTLIKCILGLLKPTSRGDSISLLPSMPLPKYSHCQLSTSNFDSPWVIAPVQHHRPEIPDSVEEVILSGLSIQKPLLPASLPSTARKAST